MSDERRSRPATFAKAKDGTEKILTNLEVEFLGLEIGATYKVDGPVQINKSQKSQITGTTGTLFEVSVIMVDRKPCYRAVLKTMNPDNPTEAVETTTTLINTHLSPYHLVKIADAPQEPDKEEKPRRIARNFADGTTYEY